MIFRKLGLIHKNQIGLTMIELLLAMTISGIVTGAITMTMFQVINGSARTNNHMTTVRQVQSGGYWVSRDANMAQNVATDNLTGSQILELSWTEWDGTVNTVVYSLEDMASGGLKNLQRSHSIDGNSFVAQYINPATTSCNFTDGVLIFTVTATVGSGSQEENETRVYRIVPRPGL